MISLRGYRKNFCSLLSLKWSRFLSTVVQEEVSPLMTEEVLQYLNPQPREVILDMTFGDGCHSEAILTSNDKVKVIALDRDPHAFKKAQSLAKQFPGRLQPLLGCFSDVPKLLKQIGIGQNSLDAVLLDVGCSSFQMNDPNRGFSSKIDGPLFMRMDNLSGSNNITAYDVLMRANHNDLRRILKIYGSESQAAVIADAILKCRYNQYSLGSTFQLRDLVEGICAGRRSKAVSNVFYALRVFVNNEFNELNFGMLVARDYLRSGGRLVTLTFNSLEDTVVKRHFTGNMLENNPNPVPLKYYSQSLNLSLEEVEKLRCSPWRILTKHVLQSEKNKELKDERLKTVRLRAAVKL